MLMDLRTLEWDDELLKIFNIPRAMLPVDPVVVRSARLRRHARATARSAAKCPSAATSAISRRRPSARCAYARRSEEHLRHRQLHAAQHRHADRAVEGRAADDGVLPDGHGETIYALEGSIAVTGSAVQWLRDQLGIIASASEIEALANSVPDNGGIYFVPAFSGLFAPYWRSDARGAIVGLSRFNTKAHLARATLEAICFQTRAVLDAMVQDSGVRLEVLKVDGGATVNDTLMQLQADVLGVPVVRPVVAETTALGAAYAAGLAVGFWKGLDDLRENWARSAMGAAVERGPARSGYAGWEKAVERTLDWVDIGT